MMFLHTKVGDLLGKVLSNFWVFSKPGWLGLTTSQQVLEYLMLWQMLFDPGTRYQFHCRFSLSKYQPVYTSMW